LLPFGADIPKVHRYQDQYGPMSPLKFISDHECDLSGMKSWWEENNCYNAVAYGLWKAGENHENLIISNHAEFSLTEIPVEGQKYYFKFNNKTLEPDWVAVEQKLLWNYGWYYYYNGEKIQYGGDKMVEYWWTKDGERLVYNFKEDIYEDIYVKNEVWQHPLSPQLLGTSYNHNKFYEPISYGQSTKCWFLKSFIEDVDKQWFMQDGRWWEDKTHQR
jgi:hypothetical protein